MRGALRALLLAALLAAPIVPAGDAEERTLFGIPTHLVAHAREAGATLLHAPEGFPYAVVATRDAARLRLALGPALIPDAPLRIASGDPTPPDDPLLPDQWGLHAARFPAAWLLEGGSTGVKVAILDSGIDAAHPGFVGVPIERGTDYVENDADPQDENGHGTHVAGIVGAARDDAYGTAGAARATLLVLRVLDARGQGSCLLLAVAIVDAVARGADVLNVSVGCGVGNPLLEEAARRARLAGAVVVAAAGNDQEADASRCVNFPARYPEALAVGALDASLQAAPFSCRGPALDLVAPGVGILSTLPHGAHETWTGTSMAAPHVTAAAALLLAAHPTWSPSEVEAALASTARDLGPPGHDPAYGHGLVQADAALA